MTLNEKLKEIQAKVKAPKTQWNNFGGYSYRSAETILEAIKPFMDKYGVTLVLSDEIVPVGDRVYVKAIAKLFDTESDMPPIEVSAWAREPATKKGMDDSQITGTASSYARKYALNGLFLLDDNKDPDSNEARGGDKITVDMVEKLKKELASVNVSEAQVTELFGLKTIEDLTVAQFNSALKKVDATRKAREASAA